MPISAVDAIEPAFRHTREQLLHPFRVARMRLVTVMLLALWSVLASIALWRDMMPGPWITAGLCGIALYFLAAGLLRQPKTD